MLTKPTFAFLDEYGNLSSNSPQRYFAVGAIIDSYPDGLVEELHQTFEGLCSLLKKDPSRLEFKFSEVTKTSLPLYLRLLEVLAKHPSWRFCSMIVDKNDPKYSQLLTKQEVWEWYLRYVKILLQKNLYSDERAILLADFYRRPKGNVHKFSSLPEIVPQLVDTLQVESQGVLLIQAADVLLGASLYQGSDSVKQKIANGVCDLRYKLEKGRFHERRIKWKVKWKAKQQNAQDGGV